MMLWRGTAATAPREFHLQMPGRINQIGDCVGCRATRQPTGYLTGETWLAPRSPKCHLWHQPGLPHGKVRNRQRKMRSNLPALCWKSRGGGAAKDWPGVRPVRVTLGPPSALAATNGSSSVPSIRGGSSTGAESNSRLPVQRSGDLGAEDEQDVDNGSFELPGQGSGPCRPRGRSPDTTLVASSPRQLRSTSRSRLGWWRWRRRIPRGPACRMVPDEVRGCSCHRRPASIVQDSCTGFLYRLEGVADSGMLCFTPRSCRGPPRASPAPRLFPAPAPSSGPDSGIAGTSLRAS